MKKIQLLIVLLMTLAVAGCGGSKFIRTEYVEGVVTLNGLSIGEGARVRFIPVATGGQMAVGYTEATGKYTLSTDGGAPQKGSLEGDYVVTIEKTETKSVPREDSGFARTDGSSVVMETTHTLITPAIYSKKDTSSLTATVVKGKNNIPFVLTTQ